MHIRAIDVDAATLKMMVPDCVFQSVVKKGYVVVSAEQCGKEIAFILLTRVERTRDFDVAWSDYYYGADEYVDVMSALYMEAKKIIFKAGGKNVFCSFSGGGNEVRQCEAIMSRSGFWPISTHSISMFFNLDELKRSDKIAQVLNLSQHGKMSFVSPPKGDMRVRYFMEKVKGRGFYLDREDYDENYSMFYLVENEVQAVAIGVKYSDRGLYIPTIYCESDSKISSVALVQMTVRIVDNAIKTMPEQSILCIDCYTTEIEKGLMKILGNPFDVWYTYEYVAFSE